MIKVANNLNNLCHVQSKQAFTVPSQEEQMLAALDPTIDNKYTEKTRSNLAQGALLGGGLGALAGLPFGGGGVIPGALLGAGIGGAGGAVIPQLLAKDLGAAGKTTVQDHDLMNAISDAKHMRKSVNSLKGIILGGGLGALAGLPFGGVGAVPGGLLGAHFGNLIGSRYGATTPHPLVEALSKDNTKYQALVNKLKAKIEESQKEKTK